MKLNLNGNAYVIRFAHDVQDKFTTCSLHEVELKNTAEGAVVSEVKEDAIYTAEAFCHWRDNFTRKTGRKVALSRLLEWMTNNRFMLTKEDRAAIWSQYFQEFKRGK